MGKRDADDEDRSRQRQKRPKKTQDMGQIHLRAQIDACSQQNDLEGALKLFRQATQGQGPRLITHSCNVLLHLCSQHATEAPPESGPPEDEVFAHMEAQGIQPTEMTFTALARCAALRKDASRAAAYVRQMRDRGIEPKLRSFTPALGAFCAAGAVAEAEAVLADIDAAKLALTESEYESLLRCYSAAGAGAAAAGWALLQRLRSDLRLLGEELLAACAAFFEAQGWATVRCGISEDGTAEASSAVQLRAVDLTPQERAELAEGIAALAGQRERAQDFEHFKAWLSETGPYDVIIDGANVGMHNRSFEGGTFNVQQVERLMAHLRSGRPDDAKPLLLVLHQHRVSRGPAASSGSKGIVARWRQNGELHTTPSGSNDDWYWLYAAVLADAPSSVLVTNDELRDHVFQMLPAPKLFYKWKERHQVRFQLLQSGVELEFPATFTTCVQEQPGEWWMLPSAGGAGAEWMLARPAGKA